MTVSRITVDGLWRCLCPAFDAAALKKAIEKPFPWTTTRRRIGHRSHAGHLCKCHVRAHHDSSHSSGETASATLKLSPDCHLPLPNTDQTMVLADLIRSQGTHPELHRAPTSLIYEALQALENYQGQSRKLRSFARYLVLVRGEKPNIDLYNALVAANWDTQGSADELHQVMKEMRAADIPMSAGFCHRALRLLAIHPHYLLRNTILRYMKSRWYEVTREGRCNVAVGLLRDGQYEFALDSLEEMLQEDIKIPSWLWDTFIYKLGQIGFIDEAVELLQKRLECLKDDTEMSLNVWYFILDWCSQLMHYEGTKYLWWRMVRPGILNPSDGTLLNTLNTACLAGDAQLATQAIQHLSTREVKLMQWHYEALVDCYARSGDYENALRVVCIMGKAGIRPDDGCTRCIFFTLEAHPVLADKAASFLFHLRKKYEIPIAALNVVLEAICRNGDNVKAVDLYRHIRELCARGPNTRTFELLLNKTLDAEIADFLAAEMTAFAIRPSRVILDSLIRSHASSGDLEIAYRSLFTMGKSAAKRGEPRTMDNWISKETLLAMIERSLLEEDNRVWDLIDEANHRRMNIDVEVQRILASGPVSRPELTNGIAGPSVS